MSLAYATQHKVPFDDKSESWVTASTSPYKMIGQTVQPTQVEDSLLPIRFRIAKQCSSPLLLGRDTLNRLPIRFIYGQRILFSGHTPPILAPRDKAELPTGEGIRFLSGSPDERATITRILLKYPDVVSQWSTTPGLLKDYAFRIDTGDAKPCYRSALPMAATDIVRLRTLIADYTARGMVRPSKSHWAAASFFVPKPGSTERRLCHDYRPLNKITARSAYPPPNAPQMIEMTSDIAKTFKELIKRFEEVLQRFAASGAKIHIHKTFKWTLADTEAFETLRSAVTSDSCPTQFDSRLPTTLYVDASATGLGAILCQIYPVTGTGVVAFASRKLSDCESRYSNTERELLAITWAVTIGFRLQLTGVSFTVFTDHQALIHECRLRVPSARVANMLLHLDCFQITLKYYPGKLSVGACSPTHNISEDVNGSSLPNKEVRTIEIHCCSKPRSCDCCWIR
jgi:hypothetical protein